MADSFFGFNTSLSGYLDEGLPDEPGPELEDEDEEEYDALNDETFGADALAGGDWEEDHEKLAEMAEQCRGGGTVPASSTPLPRRVDSSEDLDLEASLAHLVLDDDADEDVVLENGDVGEQAHTVGQSQECGGGLFPGLATGYSVWGATKLEGLQLAAQTPPKTLPSGKSVCTVEELERGLIRQSAAVLRVEDVERELTSPTRASQPRPAPVTTVPPPHIPSFPPPPVGPLPQGGFGRGLTFPPPVLGVGRLPTSGPPPFVVPPPRVVGPPPGLHPALLHQANQRLLGSNPNLLRFLPPHLLGKGLPFPGDNGLLRGVRPPGPYRQSFPVTGDHLWQLHHHHAHQHQMQNHHQQQRQQRAAGRPTPRQNGTLQHLGGVGEDGDEYAGLMSQRERHWLLGIQMLQLNSGSPHIDDYYYTVFVSRQSKGASTAAQQQQQLLQRQRERRDSQRSEGGQTAPRIYTPAQFENSLGKLQVGSVTAPRKIIDMDVVNTDVIDIMPPSQQKDSRKAKQLLLEIERLYLLLLQVEDLESDIPEVRTGVTEDRDALLQKMVNALLPEDRLVSVLCVRKGKKLVLRLLSQLAPSSPQAGQLWERLMRGVATVVRRDAEPLYPQFRRWLDAQDRLEPLLAVVRHPPRNFCLGNKFALSAFGALLECGERLSSTADPSQLDRWALFVKQVGAAAGLPTSPLPEPLLPLDATLARAALLRHCPPCGGCRRLSEHFGSTSSVSR